MSLNNILVTGGNGFIGSHVVEELLKSKGNFVYVYDINTNIASKLFKGNDRVEVVQGDILDENKLNDYICKSNAVIHMAAVLGVERTDKIPHKVLKVNLEGTIRLLELSKNNGIKKFVFASSSEVYGEPEKTPVEEDDEKLPVSIYGISKFVSEHYCSAFYSEFALNTTALRFGNVYGPRQRPEWVVSMFIQNVLRGKPPIIFGDGSQLRSFTYVKDAATATVLALEKKESTNQVFNVSNTEEISIKDLAGKIIRLADKNLVPVYKNYGNEIRDEKRDVKRRVLSPEKIKKVLGWTPNTSLDEGLKKTINWYKNDRLS